MTHTLPNIEPRNTQVVASCNVVDLQKKKKNIIPLTRAAAFLFFFFTFLLLNHSVYTKVLQHDITADTVAHTHEYTRTFKFCHTLSKIESIFDSKFMHYLNHTSIVDSSISDQRVVSTQFIFSVDGGAPSRSSFVFRDRHVIANTWLQASFAFLVFFFSFVATFRWLEEEHER